MLVGSVHMVSRLPFVVLVMIVLSLPNPAAAQGAGSERDVEALLERGISLREQQRDEEAVDVFRQALTIEDSPRVQTQLGLALLASGEFVEAYELLHTALLSRDQWVEERREAIEASFRSASGHVGIVEFTGGEPGAEVSLNGRSLGVLPLRQPAHALIGRAVVEARLDGYHPFSSEVTVTASATARLRIALVRRSEDPTSHDSDWVLPLAIGGGVLVVGGIVTAVLVATLPGESLPDVLGTVTTLQVRF